MEKYYELGRDECIKAVNEIMSNTTDLWILWQIYRFCVNMTADGEKESGGKA